MVNPSGPKFILYAGGVGSAKTTVGCLTTIGLAVAYPGDYLVCRLYLPELKLTTMKTFLELCPKELIVEHRVADGIVRLKSAGGKISNVIFRGLDEPDKHRSLNLNACYIDESSQIGEMAFLLLQSRLRGAHVRKIYMTTNPAGFDWQYRLFVTKEQFTKQSVKDQFFLIQAPSTENTFLPEGYVDSMLSTYSHERIQREIYASFHAFEGQIYTEFKPTLHVIQPFAIPDVWPKYAGVDHGYRNPAAWIWAAADYDGNLYVYREFYESEWLIEEICKKGKGAKPGILGLMDRERLSWALIDPSTKARKSEQAGFKISDFDIYVENLPDDFPLGTANNEVLAGIDRTKSWLKPDANSKPRLYIFNTCPNLIEEMQNYRWAEQPIAHQGKKNEREQPVKYKDHSVDALRYMLMGLPDPAVKSEDPYDKIKYNSLEGKLVRDLDHIRNGKQTADPFGDT